MCSYQHFRQIILFFFAFPSTFLFHVCLAASAGFCTFTQCGKVHGEEPSPGVIAQLGSVRFGHQEMVTHLAYSLDGRFLVSSSYDSTVRVWDVAGRKLEKILQQSSSGDLLVFSPDGSYLLFDGKWPPYPLLIHLATGREVCQLAGARGSVACACFSRDGKTVIAATSAKNLVFWQVPNGQLIKQVAVGLPNSCRILALSLDGALMLVEVRSPGLSPDSYRVLEVPGGKELYKFSGHISHDDAIAFSPDGRQLAVGLSEKDGSLPRVAILEASTGKPLWIVEGKGSNATALAFSRDNRRLAVAGFDQDMQVWDLVNHKKLTSLGLPPRGVRCLAFSPDGKTLATGDMGDDASVRLWDVGSGQEIVTGQPGHSAGLVSAAFNPNGKRLVTAGRDQTVRLWEADSLRLYRVWKGSAPLAFSPDGSCLAFYAGEAHPDYIVELVDGTTGREIHQFDQHRQAVSALAFSQDGKTLATGSEDNRIRLWDVSSGRELRVILQPDSYSVYALAFAPDGRILVSGAMEPPGGVGQGPNYVLIFWDVSNGKPRFKVTAHRQPITCLAFSPDGTTLASGSMDGTVQLWEAATGKPLRTVRDVRDDPVHALAFSPSGEILAIASSDEVVHLRDPATGVGLGQLPSEAGKCNGLGFSPDGKKLISAMGGGTALIWDVSMIHSERKKNKR